MTISSATRAAHGFILTKKHLSVLWGDREYWTTFDTWWGCGPDSGPVNTPRGLSHFLRQVGSKGWCISQDDVHALIRAMGRRFEWKAEEITKLLEHGRFSYGASNGAGGARAATAAPASVQS